MICCRRETFQCFFPARFVASRQPWAARGKAVWHFVASVREPAVSEPVKLGHGTAFPRGSSGRAPDAGEPGQSRPGAEIGQGLKRGWDFVTQNPTIGLLYEPRRSA